MLLCARKLGQPARTCPTALTGIANSTCADVRSNSRSSDARVAGARAAGCACYGYLTQQMAGRPQLSLSDGIGSALRLRAQGHMQALLCLQACRGDAMELPSRAMQHAGRCAQMQAGHITQPHVTDTTPPAAHTISPPPHSPSISTCPAWPVPSSWSSCCCTAPMLTSSRAAYCL